MSAKPKKLPASAIKRITLEVGEIAGWLSARSSRIALASEWIDDGRKGYDYSAVRRGGAELTPTEAAAEAAIARPDEIGAQAAEFMTGLYELQHLARKLRRLGVKLGIEWTDDALKAADASARRQHEAAGSGDCMVCKRLVSGSSVDRLRNGRCNACRVYWDRNGVERPKQLWGSDSVDAQCRATIGHAVERRCTLGVGHDGDHEFPPVEGVA